MTKHRCRLLLLTVTETTQGEEEVVDEFFDSKWCVDMGPHSSGQGMEEEEEKEEGSVGLEEGEWAAQRTCPILEIFT